MFTRSVQDFFLIALVVTTAAGYNPAASNAGNLRGAHILHSFTEGSSKLSHFFREVLHPSRIDISTSSIPGMGPAPTYRHHFEGLDPLGGMTHYSYHAIMSPSTIVLHTNPEVLSVTCDAAEERMEILLSTCAASEFWTIGSKFVGSEMFECSGFRVASDLEQSEFIPGIDDVAQPFYVEALSISRTTMDGLPSLPASMHPCAVEIEVEPIQVHELFLSLDTKFWRSPGALEEELENDLLQGIERRLSPREIFNTSAAVNKWRKLGLWDWDVQKMWEKYLIKWNYNSWSGGPQEESIDLLSSYITCRNCYAYVGANVRFKLRTYFATVKEIEVAIDGGVRVAIDVHAELPSGSRSQTKQVWPLGEEWQHLHTFSFQLWVVPVRIYVSGQMDIFTYGSFEARGEVVGPGFWFERSMTLGVSYTESRGWSLINTRRVAHPTYRVPKFDVHATAQLAVRPTLRMKFSLWNSWDFIFAVSPTLELHMEVGVSSRCWMSQLQLFTIGSMDVELTIGQPTITFDVPRICPTWWPCFGPYEDVTFKLPTGGVLPYTFRFRPVYRERIVGGGLSGCLSRSVTSFGSRYLQTSDTPDTYGWSVEVWSECSSSCGFGKKRREVTCRTNGGTGRLVQHDLCRTNIEDPEPPSIQPCGTQCGGISPEGTPSDVDQFARAGTFDASQFSTYGINLLGEDSIFFRYRLPPQDDTFEIVVTPQTETSDPDLTVVVEGTSIASSSLLGGGREEQIKLSELQDGLPHESEILVKVDGYGEENSFIVTFQSSMSLLASRPYQVTFGNHTTTQYFTFQPHANAVGIIVDALVFVGDVDLLVNNRDVDGWPHSTGTFSSMEDGLVSEYVSIAGSAYLFGTYALIARASPETLISLQATNVFKLNPGSTEIGEVPTGGIVYYTLQVPPTASTVVVDLESSEGDADIYARPTPFEERPHWTDGELYCPGCRWASLEPKGVLDSLTVSHTSLFWPQTLHVAVVAYAAAKFTISAQVYERLEGGATMERSVSSGSSIYFLGGLSSPNEDHDTHFITSIQSHSNNPADLTLLAGSAAKYYPAVRKGFSALEAGPVPSNGFASVGATYLQGSRVSWPMIIGVSSPTHTTPVTDEELSRLLGVGSQDVATSEYDSMNQITEDQSDEKKSNGIVTKETLNNNHHVIPFPPLTTANKVQSQAEARYTRRRNSGLTPGSTVPLFRFEGLDWVVVASCESAAAIERKPCFQDQRPGASTTYYKIRVPPRTRMFASLVTAANGDDRPYEIRSQLNVPPTRTQYEELHVANGATVGTVNCRYIPQDLVLSVTAQNEDIANAADLEFLASWQNADDSLACETFMWETSEWSSCSEECGVGLRFRQAFCQSSGGWRVDNSMCPSDARPHEREECDSGACVWTGGDWNECSRPCNGGLQSRLFECRNNGGVGKRVINVHCGDMPPREQECNSHACEGYFWYAGDWSECTASCGGGKQRRSVGCYDGNIGRREQPQETWSFLCNGSPPPEEQECNPTPCAESSFSIQYADVTEAPPGIPVSIVIPASSMAFFRFERPSAATRGVCIVAKSKSPHSLEAKCSVAQEKKIATCFAILQTCVAQSLNTGYSQCACFSEAINCTAPQYCSVDMEAVYDELRTTCSAAGCSDECKLPHLQLHGSSGNIPPIEIYVNPGNVVEDSKRLPSMPAAAKWHSAAPITVFPDFRMMIWESDGFTRDMDHLSIGVKSLQMQADVTLAIESLTSYPVVLQGSLLDATASAVRKGGLTLEIILTCDLFVDPEIVAKGLQHAAGSNSEQAAEELSQVSTNMLAVGIIADKDQANGWNRLVRAAIPSDRHGVHVRYTHGNTRALLTLPPFPDYNPSNDELLRVIIPSLMLRSNQVLDVEHERIRIKSDTAHCKVSEWGGWEPCQAICQNSVQVRRRTIVSRGDEGHPCPILVETRKCNTCNPCFGRECGRGRCLAGKCVCPPAFTGESCEAPTVEGLLAMWMPAPWGECSRGCGGGFQTRELACLELSGITGNSSLTPTSCGGVPRPEHRRQCNMQKCNSNVLSLAFEAQLDLDEQLTDLQMIDRLEDSVQDELAVLLGVGKSRIFAQVQGLNPGQSGRRLTAGTVQPQFAVLIYEPSSLPSELEAIEGYSVEEIAAMILPANDDAAISLRPAGSLTSTISTLTVSLLQPQETGEVETVSPPKQISLLTDPAGNLENDLDLSDDANDTGGTGQNEESGLSPVRDEGRGNSSSSTPFIVGLAVTGCAILGLTIAVSALVVRYRKREKASKVLSRKKANIVAREAFATAQPTRALGDWVQNPLRP